MFIARPHLRPLGRPTFRGGTRGLAQIVSTPYEVDRPTLYEDLPGVEDAEKRKEVPVFTISKKRGFLPISDPVDKLPSAFDPLVALLDKMTIKQADGSKGLLALGEFGPSVRSELGPMHDKLESQIKAIIESNDQPLISALFRDYCFLSSAYLLEPVDLHYRATGKYAPGRDVLPKEIARPITMLAEKLGHWPYMEYASSYALQNWKRKDAEKGIVYENLGLIRAFEDPAGSEAGFILVHIDMVAHSGGLITAAEKALEAVEAGDRKGFNVALMNLYETYQKVNESMETMWGRSKPADYLKFRSFIFGTGPARMNSMFKNGVIYEGVSDKPQYYRGESGANDSMVPLGDNLLEITAQMPKNELTDTLRDFRSYRPSTQREYIEGLEKRAKKLGVREFAMKDEESTAWYILNVDQIREFRDRHWRFTKEYIIKYTTFDIATGGSPILRYLPSNLSTVLRVLNESLSHLPPLHASTLNDKVPGLGSKVELVRKKSESQERILAREVENLMKERQNAGNGMDLDLFAKAGNVYGSVESGGIKRVEDEKKMMKRGSVGCDGVG